MNEKKFLEKGLFYNFLIAVSTLFLTWLLGGPKIDIEFKTAVITSTVLFIAFLLIILLSTNTRKREAIKNSQTKNNITIKPGFKNPWCGIINPYEYVRYPIYSAIVFLLNPALAILLRSWLYLIACILIYFLWQKLAQEEDILLTKKISSKYIRYRINSKLFFPGLYTINKPAFFFFYGLLIFAITFVVLNYSSLSMRYIKWDKSVFERIASSFVLKNNIKTERPVETNLSFDKLPAAEEKYDKPNSIVIEKIGVDAPLVGVHSTDQKIINHALNNGVVIYPGSKPPGEIGNFFVTGHSSVYPWNKTIYGQVFAALDKLEIGEKVVVYYNQRKYEYQITNKYIVGAKDVRLIHPPNEIKITLMTCWPIGTSLKRLIVEGKMIK